MWVVTRRAIRWMRPGLARREAARGIIVPCAGWDGVWRRVTVPEDEALARWREWRVAHPARSGAPPHPAPDPALAQVEVLDRYPFPDPALREWEWVLCRRPQDPATPYVVWRHHRRTGALEQGHYCRSLARARAVFWAAVRQAVEAVADAAVDRQRAEEGKASCPRCVVPAAGRRFRCAACPGH